MAELRHRLIIVRRKAAGGQRVRAGGQYILYYRFKHYIIRDKGHYTRIFILALVPTRMRVIMINRGNRMLFRAIWE